MQIKSTLPRRHKLPVCLSVCHRVQLTVFISGMALRTSERVGVNVRVSVKEKPEVLLKRTRDSKAHLPVLK